MDRHLQAVSDKYGIVFEGVDAQLQRTETERGGLLAQDAQPELVTVSSSGIPAFLSTYIEPTAIDILVAPQKATTIVGEETKKGDWTTETAMFPVVEHTGMVSSYGDYSETGMSNANVNWVQRQSYTYQIFTGWGERELDRMGLARVDWANQKRKSAYSTLNIFQNLTYFFGVAGLANYGLLNDPSLPAPIAPIADTSTGTSLVTWKQKATDLENGAVAIYNDIVFGLYTQLDSGKRDCRVGHEFSDDAGHVQRFADVHDHHQQVQQKRPRTSQRELPEPQDRSRRSICNFIR